MSKKKSAMQKGYRKQVKARPFLTKNEIIALIVIIAVIALGILLFNLFYDDGYLGADEVQTGELVTYASTDNRTRFKKVAELGEKEGFTRSSTVGEGSPIGTYFYYPETEQGKLESFSVGASFVNAAMLTDSFKAYAAGSGVEIMEPVETTINGRPAYVFAYEAEYYSAENDPNAGNEGEAEAPVEAEAAETEGEAAAETVVEQEPNTFEQNLSAYIAYDDTHTVTLHVNFTGEDGSFYMDHAEVVDYIMQYTDVINMDFAAK